MTYSKFELFTHEQQRVALYAKALSHPARIAIIQFLTETNSCFTGDITTIIPLSRTTIKQHLEELKQIGIIKGTIKGKQTNYCLNPSVLEELRLVLNQFINSISKIESNNC